MGADNSYAIVPYQFQTGEEQRERARKAGKKSGEVRRQKKAVSEYLKLMMDSNAPPEVAEGLRKRLEGLQGEDITLTAAIAYKQIEQALSGDIDAARWITELYDKEQKRLSSESGEFVLSPLHFTIDFLEPYRRATEALKPYTDAEIKDPLLRARRLREIISKGGRGSIKSSFWSEFTYEVLMNDTQAHAVFTRRYKVDLRDSVWSQWIRTVERLGNLDDWTFNVSPMRAIYKPTGQTVYFHGADKPISKKSFEVPFGYIKVFAAEECDEMQGVEQLDKLEDTFLRKDTPALSIKIFNPPESQNNFMNKYTAEKENEPTTLVCHSYYFNVPIEWLGQRFFDRAEWFKEKKPQYYANNYMGEITGSGGELFDNVNERTIKKSEIANLDIYQGIDWGYVHPQVFIRMAYDPENDRLFIIKEHYKQKTKVLPFLRQIATPKGKKKVDDELWDIYADQETICDSAEPDKIDDARDYGWNAVAATKRWKGGGRSYAWEWIRGVSEIIVDPKVNPNVAREFRSLEFEKLADGSFSSAYPKNGEDGIAAISYGMNRVIMAHKSADDYDDYDYDDDEFDVEYD